MRKKWGLVAYEARLEGKTWPEIANDMGCAGAYVGAHRYAVNHNMPWPPQIPDDVRERRLESARKERDQQREAARAAQVSKQFALEQERAERDANAYNLRGSGKDWTTIAKVLGYTRNIRAIEGAREHAEQAGLPWPLKVQRPDVGPWQNTLENGEAAYRGRATGSTWNDVANTLQIPGWAAEKYARKYAARMQKPWPVPLAA